MSHHRCCCGGGGGDGFLKIATACCPGGDLFDMVFVPDSTVCNVIHAVGLGCYQVHHEPLFVDCSQLTDEELDELPDNVVCLPDGAVVLTAGNFHCTATGTCQDAECSDCFPVFDCCTGPLGNRCGARFPVGSGTTAKFAFSASGRFKSTGPACEAGDCDSVGTIVSGGHASGTATHGNGDCDWGGQTIVANAGATDTVCDANGDTTHQDEDLSVRMDLMLGAGTIHTPSDCSDGTLSVSGTPSMRAAFTCGLAGVGVIGRMNASGAGSYGIFGTDLGPPYDVVNCRSGVIKGGRCVGVLGAWVVSNGSHVDGPSENCPGKIHRASLRAFVLVSTSKLAPCGGTEPADDGGPDVTSAEDLL